MKQAKRSELTVARILEAVMQEFGQNGYTGGKVNNICRRGINKGLIYHHFRDRDALYLACLKRSCETLVELVTAQGGGVDLLAYMKLRMTFHAQHPEASHILFEALLQPQVKLRAQIEAILKPFNALNEEIFRTEIAAVKLRSGVTEEHALRYFRQMQRMFNGYFSAPAGSGAALDAQIRAHEAELPELLQYMIFGIAEGGAAS